MAVYKVYHKNGSILADANGKEIEVHSIEYNGTWMGECFVTATFENEAPIDFSIGDYIVYRNERFEINYDPGKIKCSSRNTYGGAFKYDNVKFNALSDELVRCDMLDLVLYDNKLHYTALPQFVFYVESIDDLLDRIQANLDELYGKAAWKLYSRNKIRSIQRGCTAKGWESAYGTGTTDNVIDSTSISISDQNCWDALSLVNSQFDVNFIIRDRNVYVGTAGVPTANIFKYGKDKGLYEIEQNSESDQAIVTRLRAYGSNRNLPNRYYADLGSIPFLNITGDYHDGSTENGLSVMMEDSVYAGMFTDIISDNGSNIKHCRIRGSIDGYEFDGEVEIVKKDSTKSTTRLLAEGKEVCDTIKAKIDAGIVHVDFISGANKAKFNGNRINYVSNLPNNMACDRLMLPGFPNKSLSEWWNEQSGTKKAWLNPGGKNHDFSGNRHRPYVDSLNIGNIGIRPASVFFDQDDKINGIVEIYPTIEEMEVDGVRIDEIYTGTDVKDDGRFGDGETVANVPIYLSPKVNFDIRALMQEDFTIHMKDGMCAGREFKVAGCTKEKDGSWKLMIERNPDSSLNLYFPYNDFQIKKGDHFVLTGIELPDAYVEAASEKLLKYCIAYLDKNDYTRYVYQPKVDEIFMARQHDAAMADSTGLTKSLYMSLKEGDIMLFKDDDLGIDAEITIDQLTIKEEDGKIPTYEITLREEKEVGTIQKIQNQISSIADGNGINVTDGSSTANQIKDLTLAEARTRFLSKLSDDYASGIITFLQGLVSNGAITANGEIFANEGLSVGDFVASLFDGRGAGIDKDGNAEFESIFARAFISAAEFRFNRISVIEGEMWLTCGYGTIEEVDTEAKTITLHLEEDDYAAIAQGDICRGQYNDIGGEHGSSNKDKDTDECGFAVKRYHFTSYFKVMKILEYEKGKCVFEYELKDTSTPHPCRFMKFAQYGNEIDKSRQASAYISTVNHFYFQSMEKVNTWVIDTRMVTIRYGWLDNFPYKKKSGETAYLNGYGMYVPSNIYLGNAILNLDAASLDELTKQLGQYAIEFGTYADVLTVDDAGNVVGGLYKMNDSGEKYDYRVNSAIFVKRGNEYLTISDGSGSASSGEYKLTAYAEDCECFIDSSTLYISSVKNIKDGVAGSGDDTNFDYDAMRAMSNFKVTIVADCEGIGTISREFVVTLKHDSQPYIRMDLDKEFSAVSWNTKNGAYVGLPLTITLSAWRNDSAVEIYSNNGVPGISVAGLPAGAEYTKTINSDGKGVIAITSLPEAMNTVSPLSITASVSYAGILYERTLKHTINRFGDTNIYTLETEPTAVTVRHDTAGEPVFSAQTVACKVVCRSSDDNAYEVSPDDYGKLGISITYLTFDTDGNPDAEGEKPYTNPVPVSADLGSVRFTMTENDVVTYADVPLVLDGIDGKGIEYVYMRNNDEKTAPTLIDKSATDEFQLDDYCPPASEGGEGEATTRWTDNPVGVSQEYRFEWVAKRTKTNGRWNKFSDPKLWGRYAVDGISPYSLELTNQASLVASDEDGNVDEANVTYETTTFMVYKGSTPVLTDGYTYTVTATNISAEISESEDRMRVTITPSGITSDHAEIAVTVVPKDATDVRLANVYTLAKTRQGVTTVIYSLVVLPDVIRKNNDGTLKDTTMSVRVKKTAGKNSVLLTELPDGLSVKYSNGSGIATLGKLSDIAVSELIGNSNQVEFYLYKGEEVIDREPVGVISDGKGIKNVSNKWNVSASMTVAPTEWFDTSPELTMDTPYLWMQTTTEYTYGDPSVTTTVAGKMGDKGIDGDKTEYIFCLTKTEEAPELPESNDPIASNGEKGKWSDDPLGVDEDTWRYEWASKHTWSEGAWGAYSKPKIWARYGVKFVTGNISGGVSKTFEEWQAICGSMTGSRWYCENVAEIAVSDILVIEGTISDKRGLGITLYSRVIAIEVDEADSGKGWVTALALSYTVDGEDAPTIKVVHNYYKAGISPDTPPLEDEQNVWVEITDGTDFSAAGFSPTSPYLWNYEIIEFSFGSPSEPSEKRMIGYWSKGVDKIIEQLMASNDNTEHPAEDDSKWQDISAGSPQLSPTNKYLWNRQKIVYNDGTDSGWTYACIGAYGDTGDKGASVTSAKDYYQATVSNSPDRLSDDGWKETVGETAWSASCPYLWNKEVVSLSDNTSYTIEPHYIGTWAVGIAGVKERWAVTKANNASTIGNKDESITPEENVVPTMDANYRYLWNKQCMIYDNGTDGVWSEWKLIGTYGMSVKEIAMQYAVSGSPSIQPAEGDWSDATKELNSANRCMWIRTKPVYDNDIVNSSVDWGTPQPIGTYGQEAVQYYLMSSDDTIPVDENGLSEHGTSTGTVTLKKAVGDNLPVNTTDLSIDYYIVDYDGVETAASTANASPVTYTYSDINHNAKLRFKAYYTNTNRQKVTVCQLDIDALRKGDPGYGEDARVYSIDVNPDELHVDGLGNVSLPSTITATVKVTEGRGTPYKLYGALIYVRRYANGKLQKFEGLDYESSPTFTISDLSTYEDAIKESDYILFTASYLGTEVAKKTIPIIKEGKGFVVVSRGVFNAKGYLLGKDVAGREVYSGGYYYKFDGGVYVRDMVLHDGYYYMVSNLTDNGITEAPSPTSDVWTLASMYNLLIANAIYADGATLGGFYINDKKLWSKTDSPEDPGCPLLLDGEKGKLKAKDADIEGKIVATEGEFNNCTINDTCEVKGRLNGVTGTFTSLSALDDKGNTGATLSFGGQRLTIDGHLNQQGTVDGNSLRFYASHIWCRGSFGAYQLNTVVVEQTKAKYYYDGLNRDNVYEKTLTQETINGKSCYSLPLYSPSTDDTAAGFPVDMVLFKNGDKSMHYIFTGIVPGKMVHCINLENNNNNTYILGNSGYTQCGGGVAQTWFYAGRSNINPANDKSGGGWLIMTQYDNNW